MKNDIKSEIDIVKFIGLCVVIVMAGLLTLTSCNIFSEYRTFTNKNEIYNLSFKYPSSYNSKSGPRVVKYAFGEFFDLTLLTPRIDKKLKVPNVENRTSKTYMVSVQPMAISIHVTKVDVPNEPRGWQHPINANSMLESIIAGVSGTSLYPHFEILERSSITVSSIQADRVRYRVDELLQPDSSEPLFRIEDLVIFDYNGLIWRISSTCYEEFALQVKIDFEHVLKTFKILN